MRDIELLQKYVKQRMENDPAHDFAHIMRVFNNAKKLCKKEKANEKLVLSAALLHDIVSYPKSDKRSKLSSIKSAQEAQNILIKMNYAFDDVEIICDAIRDHSFSRGEIPKTLEGKILQDADRLDAIGAIGIARVFAVSGSEQRPFYNNDDPFCKHRMPDDKTWALDHFYQKLLKLESLMNTKSAKTEAKRRTRILKSFLSELKKEI
ncbi:HD domain-containing protein [Nitrosopumilus sp. K4]|uniref:HD domain-containing protein n=1 Tax=Nitrosopumilus sp. K4 TaxID=2795383 RepID=UPI001BAB89EC|nr:HD domain-containing protein [Nitrosopumilus sp. K4]QUC63988.1 HD domain-containing protein [Nitrosopumilus sp. K4]